MAYFPFRRLTWGGSIYDENTGGTAREVWSCSLSIVAVGFTTDIATQLPLAAPLVLAYHQSANTAISPTVALEYVKFNAIDTEGKQITDPTLVQYYATSNRGGGSGATHLPMPTATRVSLGNGTRDRRARGGFYLPRPGTTIGPDGLYGTTYQAGVLAQTDTFLTALNSQLDGSVGIASGVAATNYVVTTIRVGRVPDTQRRRRNALAESYSSAAL